MKVYIYTKEESIGEMPDGYTPLLFAKGNCDALTNMGAPTVLLSSGTTDAMAEIMQKAANVRNLRATIKRFTSGDSNV